jgi:SAM-dependent methyltransferase
MSSLFHDLRVAEVGDAIDLIRRFSPKARDVLEIGAGRGWQAKALSEAGYKVDAIDLPSSSAISGHALAREWPIRDYDGVHIPFPDQSFDVIYSSNVLEHVERLDALTDDMTRVLRPGGIALHLVPNPQWRVLSLLAYYPGQAVDLAGYLGRRLRRRAADGPAKSSSNVSDAKRQGTLAKMGRRLLPSAHGATGSALGEIGRFSKQTWDRFFMRKGWSVLHYGNNGITASGSYLLGSALPLKLRRGIGRATGGIAHVYVVRPKRNG